MSVQIKNLDMASEVQIYDNFLSENYLNDLKKLLLHPDGGVAIFPYFFGDRKVSEGDGFAQFTHQFYNGQTINSKFFDDLLPMLDILKPVSLIRIKANLQLKDTEVRMTGMHLDIDNPIENQKTGIFYMNTNNGKTIFEDGEEIESVENRMIIFPASKRHAGTTHTDTMYRCVINFNYF